MIKPKSCNKGFKSLPSIGIEIFFSKGFEVNTRKSKNPRFRKPIIDKNLSLNCVSKDLLYMLAINVQKLNIKHHKSIDPSCPAQVADILQKNGNAEFELEEIYFKEKSSFTKATIKQIKAIRTNGN